MATKQHYSIELVEEYENVNFYSIHLDGKELTELEAFFDKFPIGCEYDEEIERYGDGVGVIPIDVGNKVRLYCLRLSDKILVFGNGGVKDAATWQESESLAPYVKLLIDTSRFISSRIKDGSLVLVDKEIIGNLNFSRDEEK